MPKKEAHSLSMPDMREEAVGKAALILRGGRRAFLGAGFGAVSMDAIAREAGVSKATVYAHFGSKEELFGAVVADVAEQRFGAFSALELDPRDIEASLNTIARRFLDLVLSPEAVAVNRIIIGEVVRFPDLGDVFWQAGPERNRQQIEGFLRRAVEAGSLKLGDVRLAAEQFSALVRGEIHLRRLFEVASRDNPGALASVASGAVATFLRAFGRS